MIRYIVWVGGLAVCETKNLAKAQDIFRHWVMQDYDDVILEKVKP
jgi:hypothetical protein